MHIVLISPFATLESVGLRILSSCLRKEGHSVRMLFLRNEFTKAYDALVMEQMSELCKDADLVGVSVFTNYFDNAVQITEQIKKTVRAPVLWGGIHPTIRPEESLRHADMVCLGEGEGPVVELAQKMSRGEDFRNVRSMWFKDGGSIIRNGMHPLQRDLDLLPFPDFDYEHHFVLAEGAIRPMDLSLTERYLGRHDRDHMVLATRGCSFGCTYCCNNTLHEVDRDFRLVRKRSPRHVVEEIVRVREKLPYIRSVKFSDDAFFFYPEKAIEEFCIGFKEQIRLPIRIKGINPCTCSRAKIAMLVDAGLDSLRMGIQSGSERTKALYKRRDSNDKTLAAVRMINEFRDSVTDVQYDIILDNPWENDDDLAQTLLMLVQFQPPYYMALFSLTFYPETELYRKAKADGIVRDDLRDVYRKHYRGTRKTYMNGLFHLLNLYALQGHRMPPICMRILVKRTLLSYALYAVMLAERKMFRVFQLLFKGLRDLGRGDKQRFVQWARKLTGASFA